MMTAMKKIFTTILLAVAVLSAQSCLFEQKDIFDDSSSHRLAAAMDAAQKAIVNSEYGWLFEIYPEGSQSYGGYAFVCKFNEDMSVNVWSEINNKPSEAATSLYKMNNDNGPCILFDTYNPLMHFFSTPSSSKYQAYQGEFEYMVTNISDDVITVRSPMTGNTMYLRRMTCPAGEYLEKLAPVEARIIFAGFKGSVEGQEMSVDINIDDRQATFNIGDETFERAYTITDEGFRLYKPVKVGNTEFSCFSISEGSDTVTATDGAASGTVFPVFYPQGYRQYDEYAGNYIFKYGQGEFPVTLVPSGDGVHYQMTGVNENYDFVLTWSKAKGNLSLLTQMLYDKANPGEYFKYNGKYLAITACASTNDTGTNGYLSYDSKVGVCTVWNDDVNHPVYTFKDNGQYSRAIDTFWFCQYTGPTQTSTTRSSGSSVPAASRPFGKSNIMYNIESLTKVD